MSRGKYAARAKHEHALATEVVCRALKKELGAEKRAHAITRHIADEAEALKERCAVLELQLQLACSDELAKLRQENTDLLEQIRRAAERFERGRTTNDRLIRRLAAFEDVAPLEICEDFLEEDDGREHTVIAGLKESTARKLGQDGIRRIQRQRGIRS